MEKPQTERLGVSAVEYFFSDAGWLFREQTTHDYGIDAHVEIVENSAPTGKIIALQIKSGLSFFKEETLDSYIFRTDDKHVAYWVRHSMPVVLILFNPDKKQLFWQNIDQHTVESVGKTWKITVPKEQSFDDTHNVLSGFKALTQPEPYLRRLNRLRIDRKWMDLINDGEEVKIQFDDWVNKSLSRYQITIFSGKDKETWPTLYAPGIGIEGMLEHFFPWADLTMDLDAHEEGAESDWENQCFLYRDNELGQSFYSMPFSEWYKSPVGITFVSEDGEIASYSLFLTLNSLGISFLELDDYLSDPDAQETIGFTLD